MKWSESQRVIFCSSLLALTSVTVYYGVYTPEVFLRLHPPLSLLLYAAATTRIIPYIDLTPFRQPEVNSWVKDGDLVVSGGVKSGTHWLLYCSHQIRTKGQGENYTDVNVETFWPELVQRPGMKWPELKSRMNSTVLPDGRRFMDLWDNPAYPFRIVKSHSTPHKEPPGWGTWEYLQDVFLHESLVSVLPVEQRPDVKFLVIVRRGEDVALSLQHFFSYHRPEFKDMWGGAPVNFPSVEFTARMLLPGWPLAIIYWKFIKEWWPYRHHPNVKLLHFSDLKHDLKGSVQDMAKFMNVQLSASELQQVAHKCSFEHMKEQENKFNYILWANPSFEGTIFSGSVIRKGADGEGVRSISKKSLEDKWLRAYRAEFPDPEMREWVMHGGGGGGGGGEGGGEGGGIGVL